MPNELNGHLDTKKLTALGVLVSLVKSSEILVIFFVHKESYCKREDAR